MMRCPEVRQKLDLYTQQELAPSIQEQIEAHLSRCERCQQELRRLRRLEELLASTQSPPMPEGFAERVLAQARSKVSPACGPTPTPHRPRRGFGGRLRTAIGTAAALAAGLLVGCYLGWDTWQGVGRPAVVDTTDPLAGSGLGQLVEPGGDSLTQTFLALTRGGNG
jgi:anti-sigma factor RsiW